MDRFIYGKINRVKALVVALLLLAVVGLLFAAKDKGIFSEFVAYKKSLHKIAILKTADVDQDGSNEEYLLKDGSVRVSENGKKFWESPKEWWIDDIVIADSTNDGITDINFSVWKEGNFGSSKPFWIKENDRSVKNHFFVFNLTKDGMKALWQSSNLSAPNCEFTIVDTDKDGANELVVVEGDYADWPNCIGKYNAIWKWNGWGFSNEWRDSETLKSLGEARAREAAIKRMTREKKLALILQTSL